MRCVCGICCDGDVWATHIISVHLTKVTESFSLICILRSVRAGSWGRWSSLFPITTSVLPFDQTHVYECEEHASSGECHLDSRSSCVSWTFRRGEEVSRADSEMMVSLHLISGLRVNHLRNSLCKCDSKRYGDGTSRLATGVVGRPGDDQWSANWFQLLEQHSICDRHDTYCSDQSPQGSERQNEQACC
jgi:hypothetical protein